MQRTECNLLKTRLSSLKDHLKDLNSTNKRLIWLGSVSFVNIHVWSTETLLIDFCGMRYLKNNTKLLVNCLFSMYFAKLSPSQPTNPELGAEIALISELA